MYTQRDKTIWTQRLNGLEETQPEATAIAKEILASDEYNGWVNRETCVVAMHLSSDYELLRQALAKIGEAKTIGEAAALIERWVKEKHSILHHEPPNRITPNWLNLLADAGSLWRIDWQAVTESFTE